MGYSVERGFIDYSKKILSFLFEQYFKKNHPDFTLDPSKSLPDNIERIFY